jgi:hypothetical protein
VYKERKRAEAMPTPGHVITKAEAEYELDRSEFERIFAKHGADTLAMWFWQAQFNLPALDRPAPLRGTIGDVR